MNPIPLPLSTMPAFFRQLLGLGRPDSCWDGGVGWGVFPEAHWSFSIEQAWNDCYKFADVSLANELVS